MIVKSKKFELSLKPGNNLSDQEKKEGDLNTLTFIDQTVIDFLKKLREAGQLKMFLNLLGKSGESGNNASAVLCGYCITVVGDNAICFDMCNK